MPVPNLITDCDTNAANNSPPGTESAKGNIDNYLRTSFAFIRQLYNTKADSSSVQNSSQVVAVGGGAADAITATFSPAVSTLTNGMMLLVRSTSPNATTTPTFKADSTLAKTIVKVNNLPLAIGDISGAGHWLELTYDSAFDKWVLLNPSAGAGLSPAGKVAHFAMNAAPAGWLKANGALVSRNTYAALFAAIGTTFGAGDGSTTFALPDLRGEFLRGWTDGRAVDTGRVFGSLQTDDFKSHSHTINSLPLGSGWNYVTDNRSAGGDTSTFYRSTDNTGGAETRPRNVALLACIKY